MKDIDYLHLSGDKPKRRNEGPLHHLDSGTGLSDMISRIYGLNGESSQFIQTPDKEEPSQKPSHFLAEAEPAIPAWDAAHWSALPATTRLGPEFGFGARGQFDRSARYADVDFWGRPVRASANAWQDPWARLLSWNPEEEINPLRKRSKENRERPRMLTAIESMAGYDPEVLGELAIRLGAGHRLTRQSITKIPNYNYSIKKDISLERLLPHYESLVNYSLIFVIQEQDPKRLFYESEFRDAAFDLMRAAATRSLRHLETFASWGVAVSMGAYPEQRHHTTLPLRALQARAPEVMPRFDVWATEPYMQEGDPVADTFYELLENPRFIAREARRVALTHRGLDAERATRDAYADFRQGYGSTVSAFSAGLGIAHPFEEGASPREALHALRWRMDCFGNCQDQVAKRMEASKYLNDYISTVAPRVEALRLRGI
jgi:hypothetical protein